MPEIHIRPADPVDIPRLIELDHSYITDSAWQMEVRTDSNIGEHNHDQIHIHFRRVRLPRPVRSDYPRPVRSLIDDWPRLSGILVASMDDPQMPSPTVIGYASLVIDRVVHAVWVTDLVVDRSLRRKGIGSALLFAAANWSAAEDIHDLVLEMQPKNGPGISLAQKLGFEFCGYNDFYYPNHETGIFFRKSF